MSPAPGAGFTQLLLACLSFVLFMSAAAESGIVDDAAAAAEIPTQKEQLLLLTGRHFPLHFQCTLAWLRVRLRDFLEPFAVVCA